MGRRSAGAQGGYLELAGNTGEPISYPYHSWLAAGDWDAYEKQQSFAWSVDPVLSKLVLPPEIEPAVLVFWRR